jgi:hypothetical protein
MSENRPIDLRITYSVESVYDFIGECNKENRQSYMFGEFIIDTVYPIIMTFLLSFSIFSIYKNIDIAILPLLVLIVDYLENLGILVLMYSYPTKITILALVTSGLTTLKWVLFGICLMILFCGLFKKLYYKYK